MATTTPGPTAADVAGPPAATLPVVVPAVPVPAGRHLTGLGGAHTVSTDKFKRAQLLLGRVAGFNGITAVAGPPGSGKSFAVDRFVHTHPVMAGRAWSWLDMPPKPTTKEVTQRLLRGLELPFDRRHTAYELTDILIPQLYGSNRVIVIDEAQNLKRDGLQQLRYVHDRCEETWTLILVGSDVDRALAGAAELNSRVASFVRFDALTDTSLLNALIAWHPLLKLTPPELLLRVDTVHGRGNFRLWAQFLRALIDIMDLQPAGTLPDSTFVGAALSAVRRTR